MEAPISTRNRLWMWLKYAVSVFRRFSTRYFGICHFFLRYCGIGYPPMSPSVTLHCYNKILYTLWDSAQRSNPLHASFLLTVLYALHFNIKESETSFFFWQFYSHKFLPLVFLQNESNLVQNKKFCGFQTQGCDYSLVHNFPMVI